MSYTSRMTIAIVLGFVMSIILVIAFTPWTMGRDRVSNPISEARVGPPTSKYNCPADTTPPIGSLLQHIEMISDDGQDWYVFRCAGWQYGSISRSVQELLITFDPAQKEPSPRCWISKPQAEQRITALHLEFATLAQLQNMLNFSSVQH